MGECRDSRPVKEVGHALSGVIQDDLTIGRLNEIDLALPDDIEPDHTGRDPLCPQCVGQGIRVAYPVLQADNLCLWGRMILYHLRRGSSVR
ncbi:MAG: hypothetical protein AAFP85_07255 [Pseudomonadota bacterium]